LRRRTGGGKELAMNDVLPSPEPAPADGPGAPDAGRQLAELSDAVRRLAESQQTLLDALAPARREGGATAPQAQPHSAADDVRRIVLDVLREHDQQRHRADGRDRYVRQKMADLPDAYRRLMPQTDDPGALATAERDVRRQFREDLRAIGADATGADVAGEPATGAGHRPGAAVDYSKLSPLQQIALGLRDARPAGAGRAADNPRGATRAGAGTDRGQDAPAEPVVVGSD
jgi:hypothetical protein